MQRAIQDLDDESRKNLSRMAEDLLEQFSEITDEEIALLGDARDAAQAAADSESERLRKEIIYSMHVIRYAGGKDKGQFGFGLGASGFHGKGNGLTGIDELDLWRTSNGQGYAQVSSVDHDDPEHANNSVNVAGNEDLNEKVIQMLEDAKAGFDDMVQGCRDDFAAVVASEVDQ